MLYCSCCEEHVSELTHCVWTDGTATPQLVCAACVKFLRQVTRRHVRIEALA